MNEKPNDQYNVTAPDSLAVRVGLRVRHQMFDEFMRRLAAGDQSTPSSTSA